MSYGIVKKMYKYIYKTPNAGTVMDLDTGLEYTFVRGAITGTVFDWNVKTYDIVTFTISGSTAVDVTLYRKHSKGTVVSYSST